MKIHLFQREFMCGFREEVCLVVEQENASNVRFSFSLALGN